MTHAIYFAESIDGKCFDDRTKLLIDYRIYQKRGHQPKGSSAHRLFWPIFPTGIGMFFFSFKENYFTNTEFSITGTDTCDFSEKLRSFLSFKWNSIRLGGPALGIVTQNSARGWWG